MGRLRCAALLVLLCAPAARAADFTGFYAGVNAGLALGRDGRAAGPGLRPEGSAAAGPDLPPSARAAAGQMRALPSGAASGTRPPR